MMQFITGIGSPIQVPQFPIPQENQLKTDIVVNLDTGHLILKQKDLHLSGIGLPINLGLIYQSNGDPTSWNFAVERLVQDKKTQQPLYIQARDGSQMKLTQRPDGSYYSFDGGDGLIELYFDQSKNNWCLDQIKKGEKLYFEQETGHLVEQKHHAGETTHYHYDQSGRLDEITQSNGQKIKIDWDNYPQSVSFYCNGKLAVRHFFDELARLGRVEYYKDDEETVEYEVQYFYHGNTSQISRIEESNGASVSVAYENGRVKELKAGDFSRFFNYSENKTRLKFGAGPEWTWQYNDDRKVESFNQIGTDETVITEKYRHDKITGYLSELEHPEGGKTLYRHDINGWIEEIETQIDEHNSKLINFVRNDHGQVLEDKRFETLNPTLTCIKRYIYGANSYQPIFEITPEGRVTEYGYDERGLIISERKYRDFYTELTDCNLSALKAWSESRRSSSHLVDFEYDLLGNLSRTLRYAKVDAQGNGLEPQQIDQKSDHFGRLIERRSPLKNGISSAESIGYDAIGRATHQTNFFNHTTHTIYQNRSITIDTPAGLKIVKSYDELGRISGELYCDLTQNNKKIKSVKYLYNPSGLLYCKVEKDEITQQVRGEYIRYDAWGRSWMTYDSEGYAVQYERDLQGRVIRKRFLAEKQILDMTKRLSVESLSNLPVVTQEKDRVEDYIYDQVGRLRFLIDPAGNLVEYRYDVNDQTTHEIAYAEALSAKDRNQELTCELLIQYIHDKKLSENPMNRIAISSFDKDALEVVEKRPDGSSLHIHRDGYGNPFRTDEYANDDESKPARDFKKEFNGRNEIIVSFDAEDYPTEYVRDEAGDAVVIKAYDQPGQPNHESSFLQTNKIYDLIHRELESTDHEGNTNYTRYGFFEDPLAEYTVARMVYTLGLENPHIELQGRGYLNETDCQGNVVQELGSLGLDAWLKSHESKAVIAQYAKKHSYNGFSHRLSTQDCEGNLTLYTPDRRGDITEIIRPLGAKESIVYNAFRENIENIIYYLDPDTRQIMKSITARTYTLLGLIESLKDPEGYQTEYIYNAFKQIQKEILDLAKDKRLERTKTYHLNGFLNTETEISSNQKRITKRQGLDGLGRLNSILSAEGRLEAYTHTKRDKISTITIDGKLTDHFSFDAHVRPLHHDQAGQFSMVYDYDRVNNTCITTLKSGQSIDSVETTKTNVFSEIFEIDRGAGQWDQIYRNPEGENTQNRSSKHTVPEKHFFTKNGLPLESISISGVRVEYKHDGLGRQVLQRIHVSKDEMYEYHNEWDERGLCIKETIHHFKKGALVWIKVNQHRYSSRGDEIETIEDLDTGERIEGLPAPVHKKINRIFDALKNTTEEKLSDKKGVIHRLKSIEIDDFGRVKAEIIDPNGLSIRTEMILDLDDQIIARVDGNGNVTHYLYEDNDRIKLTINPVGVLVFEYLDAHLNLVKKHHLSRSLTTDQIHEIIAAKPPFAEILKNYQSADDQITVFEYRFDDTVKSQTDSLGHTIIHQFNLSGQKLSSHNGDRDTYYYYDEQGYLAYEIDAEGYLTRYVSNSTGNRAFECRYACKVSNDPINQRPLLTISDLDNLVSKLASKHDRFSIHLFDTLERKKFQVTADHVVTYFGYDAQDNQIWKTVFHKIVILPEQITALSQASLARLIHELSNDLTQLIVEKNEFQSPDHDSTEKTIFDSHSRLSSKIDPEGYSHDYVYDLNSDVILESDRFGAETEYRRDMAGRPAQVVELARQVVELDPDTGIYQKRVTVDIVTENSFDNNNNVVQSIEAKGTTSERKTANQYDKANRRLKQIHYNIPVYQEHLDSKPESTDFVEAQLDLTTEDVFDAFDNVIEHVTADGARTRTKFDRKNRTLWITDPNLHRTAYIRDQYDNELEVTRYSIVIAHEAVAPKDPHARTIKSFYNKINDKLSVTEPEGLYHDPEAKDPQEQYFKASPETLYINNAFHEVIRRRQLVNPYEKRYQDEYMFYTTMGQLTVEIDAALAVTQYHDFDLFGNWQTKIEFAKPIDRALLVSDIDPPVCHPYHLEADRKYTRLFNQRNLLSSETLHDIQSHEPDYSNHRAVHFNNQTVNRTSSYLYDAEEAQIGTAVFINDRPIQASVLYYGYARLPIIEIQTPREVMLTNGTVESVCPIILYGQDVFGRPVLVEKTDLRIPMLTPSIQSLIGSAEHIFESLFTPDIFLKDVKVYRDTVVYGDNDQPRVTRLANGLLTHYSYSEVSRLKKTWFNDIYYTLVNGSPVLQAEQHTTVFAQDLAGNQILEAKLDTKTSVRRETIFDAFNMKIREKLRYGGALAAFTKPPEGHPQIDSDTYFKYHAGGMVEKTNEGSGVSQIRYHDLLKRVASVFASQVHDLSLDKFTPFTLVNSHDGTIQRNNYEYDAHDNVIHQSSPSFSQTENPLFIALFVGVPSDAGIRARLGDYVALWAKPTSFNASALFSIKVKREEKWGNLTVVDLGSQMGVGLNHLVCDLYDYKLSFCHMADSPTGNLLPYASGSGTLTVVNQNRQDSQHLVLNMISGTRVQATGKTEDNANGPLTGVELLKDGVSEAYVGVLDCANGTYEANLQHLPSGDYQIRRADITLPVGEPFVPTKFGGGVSLRDDSIGIYTVVSAGVSITLTRDQRVEWETGTESPNPEPINHRFVYTMELTVKIDDKYSHDINQIFDYSVEIQNKSGFVWKLSGKAVNGHDVRSVLLHEVAVPYENTPDLALLDAQVDFPETVLNLKSSTLNLSSFGASSNLVLYDKKPGFTIHSINEQQSLRRIIPMIVQKTLRVNTSRLARTGNVEPLSVTVTSTTGQNISAHYPAKSDESSELVFDLSAYPSDDIFCKLMGPKEAPKTKEKHDGESQFVGIEEQEKVKQPTYAVTEDLYFNYRIECVSENGIINYCNGAVQVVLPNAPCFSQPINLDVCVEGVYRDGTPSFHRLGTPKINSKQWRHEFCSTHPVGSIYICTWYGPVNQDWYLTPAPVDVYKVKIVDLKNRITLYHAKPTFLTISDKYNGTHMSRGIQDKYENNPLQIIYHFKTSPPLPDDILSLAVIRNEKRIAIIPIERPGSDSVFYRCDLTYLNLPNKDGLKFQFLSANTHNNYLIENPKVTLSTDIFRDLVIQEASLSVTTTHLNSMYWKKSKRGFWPVEETYYHWEGANNVSTSINSSINLQSFAKQLSFVYVLKSYSGKETRKLSSAYNIKPYESYLSAPLDSLHTDDKNAMVQLTDVVSYTVRLKIGDDLVTVYDTDPSKKLYFLQIKPLPLNIQKIDFQYLIRLTQNDNHWVTVSPSRIRYQKNGLALIESTDFPIGHYQYRIRAHDEKGQILDLTPMAQGNIDSEGYAHGEFVISRSQNLNVQVPYPDFEGTQTFTPENKTQYDTWSNLIKEIDPKGNETDYIVDKNNQVVKTIKPTIKVLKSESQFVGRKQPAQLTIQSTDFEVVRPTVQRFVHPLGHVLGEQDANGNLTAIEHNGAIQPIREFWPYGLKNRHYYGLLSDLVRTTDRNGIISLYTNNENGVPTKLIRGKNSLRQEDGYVLNYRNNVILHRDADGGFTLSRVNILGQITDSVDPDGLTMRKLYDITNNPLVEIFPDGSSNQCFRGQFSQLFSTIDRSGSRVDNQFNYAMLLVESMTFGNASRHNAQYDQGSDLPSLHHLHHYYANNLPYMFYSLPTHPTRSIDQGLILWKYGLDLRKTAERFWHNGQVFKDMVVDYYTTGDLSFIADLGYSLNYYPDKNGNIRALEFVATDPMNPSIKLDKNILWYTYDDANQVHRARNLRSPKNGELLLSDTYQSSIATYDDQNGSLESQYYFDKNSGQWVSELIDYDDLNRIHQIARSDKTETDLQLTTKGQLIQSEVSKLSNTGQKSVIERNAYATSKGGALQSHEIWKANPYQSLKKISHLKQNLADSRDRCGILKHSQMEVYKHVNDEGQSVLRMTNDYHHHHATFTAPVETQMNLSTYYHEAKQTTSNQSNLYLDERGVARKFVDHNAADNSKTIISMPTKEIIHQSVGSPSAPTSQHEITRTSSFEGRIVAQYHPGPNETDKCWEFESANQPMSKHYQSTQPMVVEVTEGATTFRDLAKRYYHGHPEYASVLQSANPTYTVNDVLPIGAKITIPHGHKSTHLTTHTNQTASYAAMAGISAPTLAAYHIKPPKNEPNWMLVIPMAIGTIVSIVVAPHLSGLFGSELVGAMAAGAAGSLSAQASADLMGLSEGIDWTQVATATVASGMGSMIGGMYASQPGQIGNLSKTMKAMHQTMVMNMAQQGYLLATGQQQSFDWTALVSQTVLSGTEPYLKTDALNTNRHVKELTEIVLKQVMTEEIRSLMEKTAFNTSRVVSNSAQQAALYGATAVATAYATKLMTKPQKNGPNPSVPQSSEPQACYARPRRRDDEPEKQPGTNHFSFDKERKTLDEAKAKGYSPDELQALENWLLRQKYADFQANLIQPYLNSGVGSYEDRDRVLTRLFEAYSIGAKQAGFTNYHPNQVVQPRPSAPTRTITPGRSSSNFRSADFMVMGTEVAGTVVKKLDSVPGLEGTGQYIGSAMNKIGLTYSFSSYMAASNDSGLDFLQRVDCAALGTGTEFYLYAGASNLTRLAGTAAAAPVLGPAAPAVGFGAAVYFAPEIYQAAGKGGQMAQTACHKIFKK